LNIRLNLSKFILTKGFALCKPGEDLEAVSLINLHMGDVSNSIKGRI
jgi:hypothetical protein